MLNLIYYQSAIEPFDKNLLRLRSIFPFNIVRVALVVMTDRRQSLTKLVAWKVLNALPHRARESEHISSYRPRLESQVARVQSAKDRLYELEPEIRHLGRRKRPLSLVSSFYDEDVRQPLNANPQNTSWLFNLPKEVRLMIYEEVLGGMVFHIVRRKDKLGHKLCKGSGDPEQCISNHCRGFKIQSGVHAGRGNGGLIQTLQTCRKVYSEAINILYSNNVFNFDSLESFVSFSCEILPQRLDNVRRIQLDFRFNLSVLYTECTPRTNWPRWERTWRIIASMVALQEVRMRFSWPEMTKFAREELRVLEPLQLVTGLKLFEVTMPSLLNVDIKDRDDLPFRIVTKGTQELPNSASWDVGWETPSIAPSIDVLDATSTISLIR